MELDAIQRERIQGLERRRDFLEARVDDHNTKRSSQDARAHARATELLLVRSSTPEKAVVDDKTWDRVPQRACVRVVSEMRDALGRL